MTCKWYQVCPMKRYYEQEKIDEKWVENYRIIAEKASPMIMGGDESAILIFSQCGN